MQKVEECLLPGRRSGSEVTVALSLFTWYISKRGRSTSISCNLIKQKISHSWESPKETTCAELPISVLTGPGVRAWQLSLHDLLWYPGRSWSPLHLWSVRLLGRHSGNRSSTIDGSCAVHREGGGRKIWEPAFEWKFSTRKHKKPQSLAGRAWY